MLNLYIQYQGEMPELRDKNFESYGQAIQVENDIQEFKDAGLIKQFSSDEFTDINDLKFEIFKDEGCCNFLKDFSFVQEQFQMELKSEMILLFLFPENFNFKDFLLQIQDHYEFIKYIRIINDYDYRMQFTVQLNFIISLDKQIEKKSREQYVVLINFINQSRADAFYQELNCLLINEERSEYLYLLYLHKVVFMPFQNVQSFEIEETPLDITQQLALIGEGYLTALPKCIACLETIEGQLSGIDFSKQMNQLQRIYCNSKRWSQQKMHCRVCSSYSQLCSICEEQQDVWMCLICGSVGCGRYKFAHAQGHYLQTNHIFSLELLTGRIWDYNTDTFVHRLMKNRDQQILNLSDPSSHQIGNQSEEKSKNERLERLILDYWKVITDQMNEQRQFFEKQLEMEKCKSEQHPQNLELIKRKEEMKAQKQKMIEEKESIQIQLNQIRKEKGILQPKIDKMASEIEELEVLNKSMKNNLEFLSTRQQEETKESQISKIINEEREELERLKNQQSQMFLKLEQM